MLNCEGLLLLADQWPADWTTAQPWKFCALLQTEPATPVQCSTELAGALPEKWDMPAS